MPNYFDYPTLLSILQFSDGTEKSGIYENNTLIKEIKDIDKIEEVSENNEVTDNEKSFKNMLPKLSKQSNSDLKISVE